ncbi:D-alanine--D-alanine ligase family protein [Leptospira ognonensis]|uniref:D-alanine--D-alanine ligase family protein n=1 Tax=Leptospira ognonensis TaxID=2484945 RepID=UPI00143867DB|nr:D-alanine--D-alanine ligase [Leptospira ognonensis]
MKTILLAADIYEHGPEGYTQEWESEKSILLLQESLIRLGHSVFLLERPKQVAEFILEYLKGKPREDLIVFNLVEGYQSRNREGYIPSLCEYLGVSYTGSDTYAQAVCLDKHLLKLICKDLDILTPKSRRLTNTSRTINGLKFPLFIKPNGEGSSLGINEESILHSNFDFERVSDKLFGKYDTLLLEEFIPGEDITIGLLGHSDHYQLTDPARISYSGTTYSEQIKSKSGMPEILNFDLPDGIAEHLKQVSLKIANHLKIIGPARFDFRWQGEEIYFLELNLTPGLSKVYSTLPMCWENSGRSYEEMLKLILISAQERFENSSEQHYGKGIPLYE